MASMAGKSDPDSLSRRLAPWRVWVQAAFLAVWLDPLMLRLHNVCSPVFHCYSCPLAAFACPIGVLANFSALHVVPFIALGTLLMFGGVFGTFVCGWACPFGFLQDSIGKVPVRKITLPTWLSYGRYAVLAVLVIAIPFVYGEAHALFFCRACPAGALEGALPNVARTALAGEKVIWPSALKLAILALVLGAAVIKLRPWCSLFCPLGAVFGLFNRVSLFVLRFHREECDGCGACSKMCRYGVLPDKTVNNARCIRCLECTRCGSITVSCVTARPAGLNDGPRIDTDGE
jgi:ferredoxin-type protein NapH